MYGTVGRMRLKPRIEQQLAEQLKEFDGLGVPGFVRSTIHRPDAARDDYMVVVPFETKGACVASTEQNARYETMRELLDPGPGLERLRDRPHGSLTGEPREGGRATTAPQAPGSSVARR